MTQKTPAEILLSILNSHGEEAGSDYNDAEEVDGWFGWAVVDDILEVTFTPAGEDGDPGEPQIHRWQLVPK